MITKQDLAECNAIVDELKARPSPTLPIMDSDDAHALELDRLRNERDAALMALEGLFYIVESSRDPHVRRDLEYVYIGDTFRSKLSDARTVIEVLTGKKVTLV